MKKQLHRWAKTDYVKNGFASHQIFTCPCGCKKVIESSYNYQNGRTFYKTTYFTVDMKPVDKAPECTRLRIADSAKEKQIDITDVMSVIGESIQNFNERVSLVAKHYGLEEAYISSDIAYNPDSSAVVKVLKDNGLLWFDELGTFTKIDFDKLKSRLNEPSRFRRGYKEINLAKNYGRKAVGMFTTNGGKTMSAVGQVSDFIYAATYSSSSANNVQC